MKSVTRTYHPLPFEHLEPKRFEDLVRQLTYDFRVWRQLEPTGRAGSDDGFDVRGFEIVDAASPPGQLQEEDAIPIPLNDRLWLIQCKREKEIGPSKLIDYLNNINDSSIENLHGLVFVAACNFSKKSMDEFRNWCTKKGVQEMYLWGTAIIEDFLYQPKNDHLLFAYFGISLQIRRRRLSTDIHRTVALKRRLSKLVPNGNPMSPMILRDVDDKRYPHTDRNTTMEGNYSWLPCYSKGISHEGLTVIRRDHFAYYDHKEQQWDLASKINFARPSRDVNPWYDLQNSAEHDQLASDLRSFWMSLPQDTQRHVFFIVHIKYEDIIEIDDVPDGLVKVPTIFVSFNNHIPPFANAWDIRFDHNRSTIDQFLRSDPAQFHKSGHLKVFPDKYRDLKWEQGWFEKNGIAYTSRLHEFPLGRQSQPGMQITD